MSSAPIDFSNGKVRPSCYFGKAERVSTSDDPTIKIPKPFFLITSSHKNPKRENRAKRRPDFCFSNEKRGSVHY